MQGLGIQLHPSQCVDMGGGHPIRLPLQLEADTFTFAQAVERLDALIGPKR